MFKIFEKPKLKDLKSRVFNVYDAEYNKKDVQGE